MLTKTLWDFFFLTTKQKTPKKPKPTIVIKHVFTGLEMLLHLSWLAFTKLLCAHTVIARVGKRGEWEMTVNYLAGEGRGTETRISLSLQLHSDCRLKRELCCEPQWAAAVGKPLSCAGRAGETGEQSSKAAVRSSPRDIRVPALSSRTENDKIFGELYKALWELTPPCSRWVPALALRSHVRTQIS